jgi:hypothetical protein
MIPITSTTLKGSPPIRQGAKSVEKSMNLCQVDARRLRTGPIALLLVGTTITGTDKSQELTGEIDGDVIDTTGAAIPNVTVVIRNEDQKTVARTVQANVEGEFTVPLLPTARYSVNINAFGFRPSQLIIDVHTGSNSTAT